MKIQCLNIDSYNNLIAVDLFSIDKFSRKFGKFSIKDTDFKLAWRSDMIMPKIKFLNKKYLFIGIDNSIAIINLNTSKIIIKLVLQWNFMEIKTSTDKHFFVITEQSVFTFSLLSLSITNHEILPDIIESVEITKDKLQVLCMDGDSYTINY